MQKLPIGIQSFHKLRTENLLYVDKTALIYQLIDRGTYYFLSRPRRFGKSLLVSTLKEIFLGNQALFKGLWIEDKISWDKHPVLHFDFASADFKEIGLENTLDGRVKEIAEEYQITLEKAGLAPKFQELIRKLAGKYANVVILIDEYDRPITEYLDDIPQAEKNREIIRSFFSIVKPNDDYIRFLLMTGVSKFSKVSMFSGFNNLEDITYNTNYASLLGYTQSELESYFKEYIGQIVKKEGITRESLLEKIKEWYNGYDWGGTETVYNPFSILRFFNDNGKFSNYWFATGTPTFLVKLLNKNFAYNFENEAIGEPSNFENFQLDNLDPKALLIQTGYLTVKEVRGERYILGYPNKEVKESFLQNLLAGFAQNHDLGFLVKTKE